MTKLIRMNDANKYRTEVHEVNPSQISLARQIRGLTQKELASAISVTQGFISKLEQGLSPVTGETLGDLERVLKFPRRFFFEEGEVFEPGMKYMRARQSLTKQQRDRIDALANIAARNIGRLLQSAEFIEQNIPQLSPELYGGPEMAARILREMWELPKGPIPNLTNTIEDAGIIVVPVDFGAKNWDGLVWKRKGTPPIIYTNRDVPGDRLRFTLAHELGHMIMHGSSIPSVEQEEQSNAFTAEFLMPADQIAPHLTGLNLSRLAELKKYWKVSMSSLIMRASSLNAITKRQERYLFTQMSKSGLRTNENSVVPISSEEPTVLHELLSLHLDELSYTPSDLSWLLRIYPEDLVNWYCYKAPHLVSRILNQQKIISFK